MMHQPSNSFSNLWIQSIFKVFKISFWYSGQFWAILKWHSKRLALFISSPEAIKRGNDILIFIIFSKVSLLPFFSYSIWIWMKFCFKRVARKWKYLHPIVFSATFWAAAIAIHCIELIDRLRGFRSDSSCFWPFIFVKIYQNCLGIIDSINNNLECKSQFQFRNNFVGFFKSLGWKLFKRRWSILSRKMEVIKASKLICIITLGASSSEILHMCGPHPDAPCVEQHLLVIIHEKHGEWPKLLSLSLTSYLLSGLPIN